MPVKVHQGFSTADSNSADIDIDPYFAIELAHLDVPDLHRPWSHQRYNSLRHADAAPESQCYPATELHCRDTQAIDIDSVI